MVLISSCRISRVLHYSGLLIRFNSYFGYGTFTLFRAAFQPSSPILVKYYFSGPKPQKYYYLWFGLLQFRSPLLSQSLFYFLFLQVLRCFSSLSSLYYTMYSCNNNTVSTVLCSHIRISTDHNLFAVPRSFSQLITSFFGA